MGYLFYLYGADVLCQLVFAAMSLIKLGEMFVTVLLLNYALCCAQFTPTSRYDKTVLSVSCLAWRCELPFSKLIIIRTFAFEKQLIQFYTVRLLNAERRKPVKSGTCLYSYDAFSAGLR